MNKQSKQMVIDALINVIKAAPELYSQRNYMYIKNMNTQDMNTQVYQNNDVSIQEFKTWMNYANEILDISYNHIGLNAILSTKMAICQLASQCQLSNMQHIDQVKQELIKLVQIILQY